MNDRQYSVCGTQLALWSWFGSWTSDKLDDGKYGLFTSLQTMVVISATVIVWRDSVLRIGIGAG